MKAKIWELREGRWRNDHLWWSWLRSMQVCRVLTTGKQGAVEVVFGVLALISSVLLYFLSMQSIPFGRFLLFISACLILVLSSIGGALWTLRNMHPREYALTTVGDCTASEILQLVSLDIKRACQEFEDQAVQYRKLKNRKDQRCQEAIDLLKKQFSRQQGLLLRISALLELAAQQIGIPTQRLRDLLFQYDPTIHGVLAQKFIQNWESLFLGQIDTVAHRTAVERENVDIVHKAAARIRAQGDLLQYTALHPFLLRMAAPRSTAQATQEYARALSFVAKFNAGSSVNGEWGDRDRQLLNDAVTALRFLASRQRTHPGFDLNQSCLNLVRTLPNNVDEVRNLKDALNEIGAAFRTGNGLCSIDYENENQAPAYVCEKARNTISSLSGLWKYTVQQIEEDRYRIVESFNQMYRARCGMFHKARPAIRKRILVTHGFSTTVREVLKSIAPPPTPSTGSQIVPDIFIVTTDEVGDLDSRLMVSALLEASRNGAPFGRIAFGSRDTLAKFIEGDTDVMVILGAECFDKKGRVVHPLGVEDIGEFKKRLECGAFSLVVVAEGYKFNQDLLSVAPFFCHHLDRIHLYDPELIDIIISTHVRSQQYDRRVEAQPVLYPVRGNADRRNMSTRNRHILRRPISFNLNTRECTVASEFSLTTG
jgi:translation initiation factor 2B subunit (eIF-2B alpha/beta/delta family)